ncbi:NAD(P)H-dependent flavin oxidoreductase [Nocardia crassostreae]|uniref:NAD(P)H-dependent flavin oxidoreductase n=1 Tax=Nocardia crassostreae TaxID=53428 RepID=UPI000AC3F859|nr:nitronate monooxygenase [Nocardia crassostreae]
MRQRTSRPVGVGFQTWAIDAAAIEWAIAREPAAIMLSFGDPQPLAGAVRDAGIPLLIQVGGVEGARRALDLGVDVLIVQGGEAGGHGDGVRGTLPLVPAVVDVAGETPVLAAGGITDGRGLAAALVLGAAGALLGTRFQATPEALISGETAKALLGASGDDTERNRVLDLARGSAWPREFPARTLRNEFLDPWRDREAEMRADPQAAQREYLADPQAAPIWAGEGVGLITALESAADLVARLVGEAEQAIGRVAAPPW